MYKIIESDSENLLKMNNEENKNLAHRQHVKYFLRFLNVLPASLSSHDTTRYSVINYIVYIILVYPFDV